VSMFTFKVLGAACAAMIAAAPALAQDTVTTSSGIEVVGDIAKGEKVFKKCKACHAVGADAQNKVGPQLNAILGRTAATVDGFKYSKALVEKAAAETLVWTPELLDEFLKKPKDFVKGTKMSFAGIRKDEQRADVIAYLAGFE